MTAGDDSNATPEATPDTSVPSDDAPTPEAQAADAPAPDAPASNPFADLRAADLIRDAVAVTLLLVSFGMPWDAFETSTGRLYVVFATLLSIASVALPYLRRGGILPANWPDSTVRLARLIANVPYAVVVLVTLVLGYVGNGGGPGGGNGIGIGVAFGTAGAILAAQPRTSERASDLADAGIWRLTVAAIAGLIAVLTIVSLIFTLIDSDGAEWADIAYVVLSVLFFAAVALIPAGRLLSGGGSARDVLIVLGAVGVLAGFWMLGAESGGGVWSLRYSGPVVVFWPALAAAASAASLPVLLSAEAGSGRWITLAQRLFQLTVVATGFAALLTAVAIARDESGRGTEITLLVILLLALVAALVGRNALTPDARTGRPTALVVAGAFVIVGIVYAAVAGSSDTGFDALAAVVVSILFGFAAAIGYALLVPASVRADLGPVGAVSPSFLHSDKPAPDTGAAAPSARSDADPEATVVADDLAARDHDATRADDAARAGDAGRADEAARAAQLHQPTQRISSAIGPDDATRVDVPVDPQATAASPSAPSAEAATSGAPKSGRYTAAQASDPSTPLQVLADIAGSEPSLRRYVAANPSTYPELLTWLGQLGDPAVDEALRRRH